MMSRILLSFLCCSFLLVQLSAQNYYFPPNNSDTWATTSVESLGWCPEKVDSLIAFVESKNSKSFMVLKDGKIVIEAYFDTYTKDSLWYFASASKSVAAFLTGQLQEAGLLNIDQSVSDFLGEGWTSCPMEKERLITIRHLLTMTSGLDEDIPGVDDIECYEPACFQYLADAGTRWAYHTSAYRKVQDVWAAASGLNKNVLANTYLENRIGMNTYWINYILYGRARDMARFGLLMLNQGVWESDTLMYDQDYFQQMTHSSQQLNQAYGYLWWLNGQENYLLPGFQFTFSGSLIPEAPADLIAALGKNDQKIYVVPSEGLVVIRQGETAGLPVLAASSFDAMLWAHLADLTCSVGGIEKINAAELKVFPNPVDQNFTIQSTGFDFTNAQLSIYNLPGKLVFTDQLIHSSQSFSLSFLPAGVYILSVQNETQKLLQKLIVR